jgi:hypothetical protein
MATSKFSVMFPLRYHGHTWLVPAIEGARAAHMTVMRLRIFMAFAL